VLDVRNCATTYGGGAGHDAVAVVHSVVTGEGGREGRVAVEEEERAESGYGNAVHGFSLFQACISDVVALYTCPASHVALSIRRRLAMKITEGFGFRF
jgi:hypothetical protein